MAKPQSSLMADRPPRCGGRSSSEPRWNNAENDRSCSSAVRGGWPPAARCAAARVRTRCDNTCLLGLLRSFWICLAGDRLLIGHQRQHVDRGLGEAGFAYPTVNGRDGTRGGARAGNRGCRWQCNREPTRPGSGGSTRPPAAESRRPSRPASARPLDGPKAARCSDCPQKAWLPGSIAG